MVHFTGLLENARHPAGGPCRGTLSLDPCKNWLPARIGGWPGTATGGQIQVVHISQTYPPKEIIQALRKCLLGKILVEVQQRKDAIGPFLFYRMKMESSTFRAPAVFCTVMAAVHRDDPLVLSKDVLLSDAIGCNRSPPAEPSVTRMTIGAF